MAGVGEVDIELGGKTETLKATLKAAKLVSGSAGGFQNVLRQLALFDHDAYVSVVAAGLGKKPADVENSVFAAGLPSLTDALSDYVMLLTNGGKPFKAADGDGSGEA